MQAVFAAGWRDYTLVCGKALPPSTATPQHCQWQATVRAYGHVLRLLDCRLRPHSCICRLFLSARVAFTLECEMDGQAGRRADRRAGGRADGRAGSVSRCSSDAAACARISQPGSRWIESKNMP